VAVGRLQRQCEVWRVDEPDSAGHAGRGQGRTRSSQRPQQPRGQTGRCHVTGGY
jgi:hypothetical protein